MNSARFFYRNQRNASNFLKIHRYTPNFLSEGHFNRRLHRIPFSLWQKLFSVLAEYFKANTSSNEYIVDSFPIPVCENIRIFRSKFFSGKQYRGYSANKKRFFYGLKAHLIVTTKQEPVECLLAPGGKNDMSAFKNFNLDLPQEATIYADKAYNSIAERKENTKRPREGFLGFVQSYWRKRVETAFSRITSLFPKSIHAVTSKGFELKVFAFILVYSISLLL